MHHELIQMEKNWCQIFKDQEAFQPMDAEDAQIQQNCFSPWIDLQKLPVEIEEEG